MDSINRKAPELSIVIPVFNEEGNIEKIIEAINNVLANSYSYEIIFIDDGSTDDTLNSIKTICENREPKVKIKYLSFSRNFGHQVALKAGFDHAYGDCVVSMDGDLQHPPELIPSLIDKWKEGYDIVLTKRKDNPQIGIIKCLTAKMFYAMMNFLTDVEIDQGSADFRLLDQRIVTIIRQTKESPIFFRGFIKWLGFRQFTIPYMPAQRYWGTTKYSLFKMFKFALLGITSFSIKPLHLSTLTGLAVAFVAIVYTIYALYQKFYTTNTIPGWTSILIAVLFIGAIQFIMLGVLGEYLGKIFTDSKSRPSYLIKCKSND